ncbi:cobalt-precorrin-5B (C(1))-methyltransferase [Caldalkalibacillus salinus]|uniref:cobalt-precorrin-5B (C(1))-methyltransferase n=1 Tax=Caldalkalibacillus salinus TaxID=2803787 RepID=UPI0019233B21
MVKEERLREGYTTGACATAATKAALLTLIKGKAIQSVTIRLPVGKDATFTSQCCEWTANQATVGVIKDAGDDPDATHGMLIKSTVSWSASAGISLDGGQGVGRVTKKGLPVPVGEAAINPVPRKMIRGIVEDIVEAYHISQGIHVEISAPAGEEVAKKTLNERLGIIGGISILGTRGTVKPFSSAAFKASIAQAISVAQSSGCQHVVITTGGRSEKYAIQQYPHLPQEAFIEMGDFVGFTLKQCKRQGIKKVSMVGMMGKFSKVAQGTMMVHSKSAPVDFDFLARLAEQVGAASPLLEEIREANTASEVGELMTSHGYHTFFEKLCQSCCLSALKEVNGGMEVETSLYTLKGAFLGKAVEKDEHASKR